MSAISCWNEAVASAMPASTGKSLPALRIAAHVEPTDDRKFASETSAVDSRMRPSTASDVRIASRSSGAWNAIAWARRNRTVSAVADNAAATARTSVAGWSCARRAAPGGVCAKRVTASTIRSYSRALRAPGCMRLVRR